MVFSFNLLVDLVNYAECKNNCGFLIRSTCTDDVVTKWNKNSIGGILKKWITSVKKIRSISDEERKYAFLRKRVVEFEMKDEFGKRIGDGVQYIANMDCSKITPVGPTWRKASLFSSSQFHDGFLYGIEDDDGEMTGMPFSMNILEITEIVLFSVWILTTILNL